MRKGAIILCGGKSSRIGRDKAKLPFGDELMLQRVVRLVAEVVPIADTVVVAGTGQALPPLPDGLSVVRDSVAYEGPLTAMAAGFRALEITRIEAAFVTGCDAPLLEPRFIDRMFEMLGDYDAAVPVGREHYFALAAVYRPAVLGRIVDCIDRGLLRVRDLIANVDARHVSLEDLRDVDIELRSLMNVNNEDEYRAALALKGSLGIRLQSPNAPTCVDHDLL